jgi:hypothetical protein
MKIRCQVQSPDLDLELVHLNPLFRVQYSSHTDLDVHDPAIASAVCCLSTLQYFLPLSTFSKNGFIMASNSIKQNILEIVKSENSHSNALIRYYTSDQNIDISMI